MKVIVWSALERVGTYATGVGKHVLRMSTGLAARQGWETRLLMSSDIWARDLKRAESSEMDFIPSIRLPFSRRLAEGVWRTIKWPRLDRWVTGFDWVYCPKELYVPVRRAKFAITVHDLYRLEPDFRLKLSPLEMRWSWLLRRAMGEADLVLTVSEFTKSRLVDLLNVPQEKIRVVGNGVDVGFFEIAKQEPMKVSPYPKQQYILTVGGVTHKKGGGALLATAKRLERVAPHLMMVVTGPVAPEFASKVIDQKNLLSLKRGFPDRDMHRLVRGASVGLILSEYEGFGIPVLEAMAAGVPIIAARRASLPEVVGDAGILVEPTQANEVAQTVVDLLNNERLRTFFIDKGHARAKEFSWQRSVDRLCAAMEEFGIKLEK